jgi:hypothetical protein
MKIAHWTVEKLFLSYFNRVFCTEMHFINNLPNALRQYHQESTSLLCALLVPTTLHGLFCNFSGTMHSSNGIDDFDACYTTP